MAYTFLIAFVVVVGVLLLERLKQAEIRLLALTLKWTLIGVFLLAAICLTLTGRLFQVAFIVLLLVLLCKQDLRRWFNKDKKPSALPPPSRKKKEKKEKK